MDPLPIPGDHLHGDEAAAATPQGLVDRRELAFIAVERTRMAMVVTDPRQDDNPIVLANSAFLELTGYSADEVLGQNCRFLQGPDTSEEAIAKVRAGLVEGREIDIVLLNYRRDGSQFWNALFISPIRDDDGQLLYYFASQKDVTVEREAQHRDAAERRLMREIDHRAQNVLALVQGIVRMSRADSSEAYAEAVQGRVQALARAHTLLADRRWREVPLEHLIVAEAEPFAGDALEISGPPISLPPNLVQPIALVIFELVSNASQHGALSAPGGRAAISWHEDAEANRLILTWSESGGPPPPGQRELGFGLTIISNIIERQLRGALKLDWHPSGLAGELIVPMQRRAALH